MIFINMKKTTNVIFKLDGPEIEDGIDLFELAPSLINIGIAIKESNNILFPSGKEIGINIKPFGKGSFLIEIALFAKTHFAQLISFLKLEEVQQIKTLLEWLGITVGTSVGLTKVIRFLKGKPKKIEKLKSGDIKLTNDINFSITVNQNVFGLYNNPIIRQNISKGYSKLLEQEGVNKIESYIKEKPEGKETIIKDDKEAFIASIDLEDLGEEHIKEIETFLKFKRGSFAGEIDNWSFWWGTNIINTTIRDENFINNVKDGNIRPNHRDLFKVLLGIKQIVMESDILQTSYEVVKVLEYKEGPSQLKLPNN